MNTQDDGTHGGDLLARLDRLTDLLNKRLDAVDARLDGMEQDMAEILGFLIALKAGIEGMAGDLADDDADTQFPEDSLH
jgi:hypothetical protein